MRFRWWWLVAALVAVAMLGAGLFAGQWNTVRGWAEVLCTGCIGLW